MVADFYEVDEKTINRYLKSHEEELKRNGYFLCDGKLLKEFKLQFVCLINETNKTPVIGLFNFRAFLNIGMLLSESEKAKQVRSLILDIVIATIHERTGGGTKYIIYFNFVESRKQQRQMRQSEEMHKAKDKIFSIVSHDVRGSMANLISILRLTTDREDDSELKMELLKDAATQLDKNFEMVDNLLRWAKSQMQGIVSSPSFVDIQKESLKVTDRLHPIAANKTFYFSIPYL